MNQKEAVFKYAGNVDESDIYVAKFQLPDDGCPDSEQFLEVKVEVSSDNGVEVILHVHSCGRRIFLTSGPVRDMGVVSRLLYGTARVVTKSYIEPL